MGFFSFYCEESFDFVGYKTVGFFPLRCFITSKFASIFSLKDPIECWFDFHFLCLDYFIHRLFTYEEFILVCRCKVFIETLFLQKLPNFTNVIHKTVPSLQLHNMLKSYGSHTGFPTCLIDPFVRFCTSTLI